ncbi:MAG: hypothetical protein HRT44_09855 [Bdellovibrionales bacterium]|nr:hypothetical protein [Bdellovibrionales bacterium]
MKFHLIIILFLFLGSAVAQADESQATVEGSPFISISYGANNPFTKYSISVKLTEEDSDTLYLLEVDGVTVRTIIDACIDIHGDYEACKEEFSVRFVELLSTIEVEGIDWAQKDALKQVDIGCFDRSSHAQNEIEDVDVTAENLEKVMDSQP